MYYLQHTSHGDGYSYRNVVNALRLRWSSQGVRSSQGESRSEIEEWDDLSLDRWARVGDASKMHAELEMRCLGRFIDPTSTSYTDCARHRATWLVEWAWFDLLWCWVHWLREEPVGTRSITETQILAHTLSARAWPYRMSLFPWTHVIFHWSWYRMVWYGMAWYSQAHVVHRHSQIDSSSWSGRWHRKLTLARLPDAYQEEIRQRPQVYVRTVSKALVWESLPQKNIASHPEELAWVANVFRLTDHVIRWASGFFSLQEQEK